jgi:hypothetical protein
LTATARTPEFFCRAESPRIFPTSDYEHARILEVFKQDRPYEGILNDFSEYALGEKNEMAGANLERQK